MSQAVPEHPSLPFARAGYASDAGVAAPPAGGFGAGWSLQFWV